MASPSRLHREGSRAFIQPLSLTSFDSSPSRGASGETVHFAGTAKASPTRSNGDDRRQRRKQGGAVGAAASGMQATAQQTLGAATRPCLRSRLRGCTKTEPSLCRKVRLVAALPVSFCRSLWYTCFAPGARALTPDQQDGAGEKTCCCCRRTCFFKLYADKLEKRRFTQNVQPQKNCGLLWHYR